jgi:tRNA (mo5U34)-methyltransferase
VLQEEIACLGPWHQDIEIAPGVSTAPDTHYKPRGGFHGTMRTLYPSGLAGRSVLDCACTAGGYLFWARELGAGPCYGFDVREHWIRQARFVAKHRESDGIRFEVRDLYDLPSLGLEPFDITIFSGLFYHLPDPIRGLKIAADLTREFLLFGSVTMARRPDGYLAVSAEGTELLSGVYGLNWLPTGPEVIRQILAWAGFAETRVSWWFDETTITPGLGRVRVLASKRPGLLAVLDRATVEKFLRKLRTEDSSHTLKTYCKPGIAFPLRDFDIEAIANDDGDVLARLRHEDDLSLWRFRFEDGDIAAITAA